MIMKKVFLIYIIFLSAFLSNAQEIFTDVYMDDIPLTIAIHNNQLYVGTFLGQEISRLDLTQPNPIPELVSDISDLYILKMIIHEPSQRLFFIADTFALYSIDLTQTTPITYEVYHFFDNSFNQRGLTIDDDLLYISGSIFGEDMGSLFSINLNIGPTSLEFIRNVPVEMLEISVYNNEIYYRGRLDPNQPTTETPILKADLVNTSNDPEIVAENLGDFAQKIHMVDNYMYVGTDDTNGSILRFNLNEEIPLNPTIILDGFNGPVPSIANASTTFYAIIGSGEIITFEDSELGLDTYNYSKLNIFPNPSSEKLFIQNYDDHTIDFSIFEVLGKRLQEGRYSADGIDISNFERGIYFLSVTQEGKTETVKFVKN
jgi:Secretion system C-terminal sorting domain